MCHATHILRLNPIKLRAALLPPILLPQEYFLKNTTAFFQGAIAPLLASRSEKFQTQSRCRRHIRGFLAMIALFAIA